MLDYSLATEFKFHVPQAIISCDHDVATILTRMMYDIVGRASASVWIFGVNVVIG